MHSIQKMLPFQSTPSVWRETPLLKSTSIGTSDFNPLPPCGGRQQKRLYVAKIAAFQSTPSVWRETVDDDDADRAGAISIHSLRVEGDNEYYSAELAQKVFQSTPSVWRETVLHKCML